MNIRYTLMAMHAWGFVRYILAGFIIFLIVRWIIRIRDHPIRTRGLGAGLLAFFGAVISIAGGGIAIEGQMWVARTRGDLKQIAAFAVLVFGIGLLLTGTMLLYFYAAGRKEGWRVFAFVGAVIVVLGVGMPLHAKLGSQRHAQPLLQYVDAHWVRSPNALSASVSEGMRGVDHIDTVHISIGDGYWSIRAKHDRGNGWRCEAGDEVGAYYYMASSQKGPPYNLPKVRSAAGGIAYLNTLGVPDRNLSLARTVTKQYEKTYVITSPLAGGVYEVHQSGFVELRLSEPLYVPHAGG